MANSTATYSIILALFFASVSNMVVSDVPATPIIPPKKCTSGLGPCSANCGDNCCAQMCINDYTGLHPQGECEDIPGIAARLCTCRHDCFA